MAYPNERNNPGRRPLRTLNVSVLFTRIFLKISIVALVTSIGYPVYVFIRDLVAGNLEHPTAWHIVGSVMFIVLCLLLFMAFSVGLIITYENLIAYSKRELFSEKR